MGKKSFKINKSEIKMIARHLYSQGATNTAEFPLMFMSKIDARNLTIRLKFMS